MILDLPQGFHSIPVYRKGSYNTLYAIAALYCAATRTPIGSITRNAPPDLPGR
jgi:hypothetical protein